MIRALPLLFLAAPAFAFDLSVPGEVTHRAQSPLAIHHLATGPAVAGAVPVQPHEGPTQKLIWQIPDVTTTLAILAPMREQLVAEGFEITFACQTTACGGYDFRFGIDVTPAPDMFVDLSDYHYIAAHRDDAVLSLIVSRSGTLGYVQLDLVGGPDGAPEPEVVKSTRVTLSDIGAQLETDGVAVLEDVVFDTGSATLAGDNFPSLETLATYLTAFPDRTVALVGHTDAEGSLDGNLGLSDRRAAAVRRFLVETLGVSAAQVEAKGIAFLAPRASNLTDSGRAQNRRVEVVLTSTR